jgi:predicted glutamine amidotransferase
LPNMCGIIAVKDFTGKSVAKFIRRQYARQKHRGTEGFGFVEVKDGQVYHVRTKKEHEIMKHLKESDGSEILFHHRYPTSAPNEPDYNHPILISSDKLKYLYLFLHNGVVSNDYERRIKHEEMGIQYRTTYQETYESTKDTWKSQNDSEALGIDIALFIEGAIPEIEARSSAAFVMMQVEKDGSAVALHYGRNNSNPLKIRRNEQRLAIASELPDGEEVKPNTLFTFNYATAKTTEKEMILPAPYSYRSTPKPLDDYTEYDDWGTRPRAGFQKRLGVGEGEKAIAAAAIEKLWKEVQESESELWQWGEGNGAHEVMELLQAMHDSLMDKRDKLDSLVQDYGTVGQKLALGFFIY